MRRALSRLRWQLTLSHLIAIAFTLVSMLAALLLIASTWWARASNPALQPAEDARVVASSVEGLVGGQLGRASVSSQAGSAQLSTVLGLIAHGDVRLSAGWSGGPPDAARGYAPMGPSFQNLAYLAVVGADGRVLGTSDPAGATFAPAERPEWTPLVDAALTGTRDPTRLVTVRTGNGPVALGAYPIVDPAGHPVAAALVAKTALAAPNSWMDFWHALIFFGAASLAVLAGASVFALTSSSLLSYLLARRLVRRLERLGRAVEAFAAGDLRRRVDAEADASSSDEVGQLARRFNSMAAQLADTLAELETEKQHAEAALEAKRNLVANVSHELRTPLASIRGHTESLLMSGDIDRDARRAYLDVIHRQSEQLSRLIDDLFLLSTTEAGALGLALRPVVLGDVIQEVVNSIHQAAHTERQVSLLSEIEPSLAPVLADRQRVAQVIANLVRNAVRHTPEGGLVAVRAARRDDRLAVVTVEDTGVGIPPQELEHVFERFYRADPSRDRASGGAGLGLAIVRELVVTMGGDVSAESVVGEGSRFSFTLPLVQETAEESVPDRSQVRDKPATSASHAGDTRNRNSRYLSNTD
jgi:signal transduction histidine kinase